MPTNTTTLDLAEISTYLWGNKIGSDNAFKGGSPDNGRDVVLYTQRKALEYGIDQSLSGVTGVAKYVYALIGGQLPLANQVLVAGSGGIVPNPSGGGSTSLTVYRNQFNVGDSGALFVDGGTTATINIGVGNNFLANSIQVELDQVLLPQNNSNYISYTVSYAAGVVQIVLNQAAQLNQLYVITFDYIII
jgi:hypothetical protein